MVEPWTVEAVTLLLLPARKRERRPIAGGLKLEGQQWQRRATRDSAVVEDLLNMMQEEKSTGVEGPVGSAAPASFTSQLD